MYEQLSEMRGFSEDCIKSTLHRFICTLIQLTKNSDYEVCIQIILNFPIKVIIAHF